MDHLWSKFTQFLRCPIFAEGVNILRDDGINYSDYVTELVLLLFIKMVHENTESGTLKRHALPVGCRWTDLNNKSGINLLNDYKTMLSVLATGKRTEINPRKKGQTIDVMVHDDHLIKVIYSDAQTRLREPRHLEQIIHTLDKIDWFSAQKDGLGDLYEGLLEKNASETKSGAGQYFTPRALINCMVRCIKPQPGEIVQDPAAGTAGFLVAAYDYIKSNTNDLSDLSKREQNFQKNKAFIGIELVPNTRRLALMNCLLHGIEGDDHGAVQLGNALSEAGKSLPQADVILANPPFGVSKGGDVSNSRDDLTYKTSNKQLAFLQHIYRNLKPGVRAAVVFPDNVLFDSGVGTEVRRDLMNQCNLHTILRLPTGIFYAQGVNTNVLFFTKGSAKDKFQRENCTKNIWVYDLRTNIPSFGKRTPFEYQYLMPFEKAFGRKSDGTSKRDEGEWSFDSQEIELENTTANQGIDNKLAHSRWRCFSRQWIAEQKGDSLDISWLKDKSSLNSKNLPEPSILATEVKEDLVAALVELDELLKILGADK